MTELAGILAAAAEVEDFCRKRGWRFCFIGGLAVQRWGMPRFTQDVDLTLFTGFGSEAEFIDPLLGQFSGRLLAARQFALDRRVLLVRTTSGVDVDVALGAFPFEEAAIARASLWTATDLISLTTCSAEDLLIHKVFASRDRDWADVETVLSRRHGALDLAYVRHELPPLLELKDDVESLPRFEALIATVDDRLRAR